MYLLGLEKNIRTCNEFEMQEHMKMLMSCFQEYDLNLTNWVLSHSFISLIYFFSCYLFFFFFFFCYYFIYIR
jgi:hypothetical protein